MSPWRWLVCLFLLPLVTAAKRSGRAWRRLAWRFLLPLVNAAKTNGGAWRRLACLFLLPLVTAAKCNGGAWRRLACLFLLPLVTAAKCNGGGAATKSVPAAVSAFRIDRAQVAKDLGEWTSLPHVFGSPRQAHMLSWLKQRLADAGVTVVAEPFQVEVPNPEALTRQGPLAATLARSGSNLYGIDVTKSKAPCVVMLASHIDTKELPNGVYLGANDSGSSSVLLLQLLAYLRQQRASLQLRCDIAAAFFDGEESVLPEWNSGEQIHPAHIEDHTYGSRYAAGRLQACPHGTTPASLPCLTAALGGAQLSGLILLDMVGSPQLRLTRDSLSSPQLQLALEQALQSLQRPDVLVSRQDRIEDDHVPFLQRGVPAIDLIDFEHLRHWHQPGDDAATIDPASLELAGQVALSLALELAR